MFFHRLLFCIVAILAIVAIQPVMAIVDMNRFYYTDIPESSHSPFSYMDTGGRFPFPYSDTDTGSFLYPFSDMDTGSFPYMFIDIGGMWNPPITPPKISVWPTPSPKPVFTTDNVYPQIFYSPAPLIFPGGFFVVNDL